MIPLGCGLTAVNSTDGVVGSNLRLAYGEKVDVCEKGTRTQVLEAIRRWAVDIDTPEQIFWLNDAGGTGKSTIAATMAKEWQLEDHLAGRFFFSPNARVTERTEEFCLAIAEDIRFNQYTLWDKIDQAIQKKSPEHRFHFDIQLQQLVIEPLQSLQTTHPIYLVIDALDNCADREQREVLLETFIRHLPSIRHLKVLLTSRPLQDISNVLKGSSLVYDLGNHLLDSGSMVGSDIALYVNRELGGTPKITSDQREMIVTQSGGLFLYASTVCRMLKKSHRLSEVLKYLSVVEAPQDVEAKMDELYLSVLKQAIVDDTAGQLLMDLLSIITVTFEPVSINTIGAFLPDNDQIDNFVQDLSGVLTAGEPDRPIKVLHPTFREFLLSNPQRTKGFSVNPSEAHARIAIACINILEKALRYDILHVEGPDNPFPHNFTVEGLEKLIVKHTTGAILYASNYWAHHVAESDLPDELCF
ncbi:hypothetical protein FRB91_005454 [Serendipita sp. 411]|nr:hypothetical protein FRB91_005454 [Serendipita sp. 411]